MAKSLKPIAPVDYRIPNRDLKSNQTARVVQLETNAQAQFKTKQYRS
jgi:hypothetical protein